MTETPLIRVREARADDAAVIVAFQQAMAWETESLRLDEAVLSRGVRAVLEDPGKGRYFIAEADGAAVGSLMITREYSDWRAGWFWWIQSVYVVEAWRRNGVFRSLYRFVQQLASQASDVCGLRLYVDHDNDKAQRTYADLGMQRARYTMFETRTVPDGTE